MVLVSPLHLLSFSDIIIAFTTTTIVTVEASARFYGMLRELPEASRVLTVSRLSKRIFKHSALLRRCTGRSATRDISLPCRADGTAGRHTRSCRESRQNVPHRHL